MSDDRFTEENNPPPPTRDWRDHPPPQGTPEFDRWMKRKMRTLWPDKYDAAGNEIKAPDKPKEREQ